MEDHLTRRAMAAYFRSGDEQDQPGKLSGVERDAEGRKYVVLRGGRGSGILAVYRVRTDGILKRLKRWPKEIE